MNLLLGGIMTLKEKKEIIVPIIKNAVEVFENSGLKVKGRVYFSDKELIEYEEENENTDSLFGEITLEGSIASTGYLLCFATDNEDAEFDTALEEFKGEIEALTEEINSAENPKGLIKEKAKAQEANAKAMMREIMKDAMPKGKTLTYIIFGIICVAAIILVSLII